MKIHCAQKKKSEDELFARKRREYMANNWADDTEELPPLGTLSKDESTKTTSTPAASAGKTSSYVHRIEKSARRREH